jgi:DNA topoisomerase-2
LIIFFLIFFKFKKVNASDNKQRDKNMSVIRVNIDKVTNTIKVFNNGRGIPVVMHKEEKILVPTLIFGHLLTSSNYNDDEKKVTGKIKLGFFKTL